MSDLGKWLEKMDSIYLTHNSFIQATLCLLTFLVAIYLFARGRKHKVTLYLAFYFAGFTVVWIAWIFRNALPGDWGERYYFVSWAAVYLAHIAAIQFAYYFPQNNPYRRESRIVFYVSVILGLLAYGDFLRLFLGEKAVYSFHSHSYDFPFPLQTLLIIVYYLWAVIVSFRKAYFYRGNRVGVANRAYGLVFFVSLFSSIMYGLHKGGLISWKAFSYFYAPYVTVLILATMLLFLNYSRRPAGFMVKLIGISLATFLVVFGTLGNYALNRAENFYDRERVTMTRWAASGLEKNNEADYPAELQYLISLDTKENGGLLFSRDPELSNLLIRGSRITGGARDLERGYRELSVSRRYIFFRFRKEGHRYEAGFDYYRYRAHMHQLILRIIFIILGATFLLLLIYPLLFRVSVTGPLEALLGGVRKVNKGDYEVHVPVQMRDEIGFLTQSFNQMVGSVRQVRQTQEKYADMLEHAVQRRTHILNRTLERVKQMKIKQDADYFLTTQLIEPLMTQNSGTGRVQADYFIEQKKKFKYKKNFGELGGDFCLTDEISLNQRSYMVFLNADAMGKSMQGAGGILALGSSFKAALGRFKSGQATVESPGVWLKQIYEELHRVFIAFDGSMLISAIMGLAEQNTGRLYFINMEHPRGVLYREGRAHFLEEGLYTPKLGDPMGNYLVHIQEYLLLPGDVVLFASDGRDDVMIAGTVPERMNFDDELFLHNVEEGDGDPARILKSLKKKGRLIDDFSLLRLQMRS